MKTKTETYVGFAIKKGSVVFGADAVKRCRKKVYLLLATETLSPNSLKAMRDSAQKFCCKLITIPDYDFLKKRNCKALAICDRQLADAVTNDVGGNNG